MIATVIIQCMMSQKMRLITIDSCKCVMSSEHGFLARDKNGDNFIYCAAESACYFQLCWWTSQVFQIKKIVKRLIDGQLGGLGFLRRNIKIHSESLKSSAYKVLVRPQLEYCTTVWCPFTDSNISKLEAVQRKAARWVKHDYGQTSSVTGMMQSLHWRRLDQRRIDKKFSLVYKITHNLIAIPISDFLAPLVRPSRHYHPLYYRPITATTDYYNFPVFPRAVFHWNHLLETVALEQFNQALCKIDHVSP